MVCLVSSVGRALASKLRGPGFQIPARYSGWPCHYNKVGCSARFEISFELNLLPRVNKVTLLLLYFYATTVVAVTMPNAP